MQDKLDKLLKNSHSPYSHVCVSAIAVDKNGKEYEGVNVENASYGGTICAERAAILHAISMGVKSKDFKEINLTSSLDKPLYPCGLCLQFIAETFDENAKINVWYKGKKEENTIKDLMPKAINKGSFGWE